jgi:hypothetical protein
MEMLADGSALVGHDAACDLIVLGSTATERITKSQPRFDEQSLRLVDHADDTRACQCRILDGRSGESFGPARMAKAHHHTARKMDVDDGCVMLFPKRYKAEGGTALADMWHACRLERSGRKCQPRRIGKGKSPAGSGASPPLHRVDTFHQTQGH